MNELMQFQHFHFLRPFWLLALIVGYWLINAFTKRSDTLATWRPIMSKEIIDHLNVEGNTNHWLSPRRLGQYCLFLLCLILSGPTWQQQPSPLTEDNSALVIALDVSNTMQQSDVQPTRLARAKHKIIELLKLRGDSNTALIAYSGSAHTVMPITKDTEMISHFLDALDSNLMPMQGKLPEKVIPITQSMLSPTKVPGSLLLIGDGATAETVAKFSEFFNVQPHQLVVWAIGNTEQTLDSDKNIIPMQLAQLENLADESGGRIVELTFDNHDVEQVNRFIENNLVIVEDAGRPWLDAGYPLVFILALMFLFWFRRGWTLQW
ncbi:VWA domain-containing protein [Thalassotalea nanhaiensis]|uniref:VWA domain-containing protein n=1 Tax=Thalassotalea nanhaiensis TaxID=3065648 RepID=A0ABY9TDR9_9GAMM|nr:VWA domain-containing protein [Colwelliaceae bacterium SQ345]